MNKIILVVLFFIAIFGISKSCPQDSTLSKKAKTIKMILEDLKKNPNDTLLQKKFLRAFPCTLSSFDSVFSPEDFSQLYSEWYDYTEQLYILFDKYPIEVTKIVILVCKDNIYYDWGEADLMMFDYIDQIVFKRPDIFFKEIKDLTCSGSDLFKLFTLLCR